MSGNLLLLSIVNWLHLTATVTWIGAIITNTIVLLPAAKTSLEPPVMGRLLGVFMKRFRPLVYVCIVTLFLTGVIMMVLNKYYDGLMNLGNPWAQLLLIKHILIIIMVIIVVYAFEILAPKVGRLAAKGPSPELANAQKLQMRLATLGLVTALVVLLLTSVITAISSLP